ncbi:MULTISPECIES: SHOCT domain-containing protein [unclassified Streptomyces]|uniref:SHOCT domain-containing protein n=1 Tax=unclassified Streptomyces TaxID=2593676 RepID=UPI0023651A1C|nr:MULTISPECIES: SHOCT domain-containing protein [unclassified Streptomyces]MDF3146400.1 SHOCT domain-containing protein [Streptomyces sp. T21Q-yed]WDF37773.1 SHOCT domain-containing protein [Streptomyces sp. T12]
MDYPLLNVFLTMLWFFLWIMWLMLLFRVVGDIFRDDALSGWGKAGWTLTVCVLPFLGVFVYLIARGRGMGEREMRRAQDRERAFRAYVQQAAAAPAAPGPKTPGVKADELGRLAALHDRGAITDAEYEQAKSKVLTS